MTPWDENSLSVIHERIENAFVYLLRCGKTVTSVIWRRAWPPSQRRSLRPSRGRGQHLQCLMGRHSVWSLSQLVKIIVNVSAAVRDASKHDLSCRIWKCVTFRNWQPGTSYLRCSVQLLAANGIYIYIYTEFGILTNVCGFYYPMVDCVWNIKLSERQDHPLHDHPVTHLLNLFLNYFDNILHLFPSFLTRQWRRGLSSGEALGRQLWVKKM